MGKKKYLAYLFQKSQKSTAHLLNSSETTSTDYDAEDINGGIVLANAVPQTISYDYQVTSTDSSLLSAGNYLPSGDYLIVFMQKLVRLGIAYTNFYLSIYDTVNNSTLYTSDIWGYGKTEVLSLSNYDRQKYQDLGSVKFYVRIPQSERYQLYVHTRMEFGYTDGSTNKTTTLNITKLL